MSKKIFLKGIKIEMPAGQSTTDTEYQLPADYEMHGMIIMPENPIFGDKLDMKIMVPVPGQPDAEVYQYAETAYLTSNITQLEIMVESKDDAAELLRGLKIKVTYNAVDVNGRKAIVWIRFKKS